jgi:hypothetical protein
VGLERSAEGPRQTDTLKPSLGARWRVSLPRFVAGPISFGVNAGFVAVAGVLLGWEPTVLPWLTLIAWGAGVALTAVTLTVGWPIFHTAAAGALLAATVTATGTTVWPLPLAGAAVAIAMARFASVGVASRWLSRSVGLAALAMLGLAGYLYVGGDLTLGPEGADGLELVAGAIALLVVAVLGLWHGSDEEDG